MAFNLKRFLKRSYQARFAAWLLVLNWVDMLAMVIPVRPHAKTRRRVVFVKMDAIGDYVIWSSTFRAIDIGYPADEYERVLVANDAFEELAKNEPIFDKAIFLSWERFAVDPIYRFRAVRNVRRVGADIVINPRFTREFLWSDSIVRCSGAKERIGSVGIDNHMTPMQERITQGWYTTLVAAPKRNEHELVSLQNFLDAIEPEKANTLEQPFVDLRSAPPTGAPEADYAVLFLGASSVRKMFPVEKFAAVGEFIATEYGLRIVICGGPGEEKLGEAFRRRSSEEVIDLTGRTTLGELAALIKNASLVVANDTGAAHFAAVSETPTVVLTPGNHVGRFFPYPDIPAASNIRQLSVLNEMPCFGCGWDCIYTDLADGQAWPCVEGVEVDNVIASIAKVLRNSGEN
ncbi:MAG: glycosyltransferase family 9 protein [Pyrinomonadaceae bacterium]